MNIRKPATRRPTLDEDFLTRVILENSPLDMRQARKLAATLLTEIRRMMGSRGGRATKAKYGAEHYSKIGKLGGRPKADTLKEEHR